MCNKNIEVYISEVLFYWAESVIVLKPPGLSSKYFVGSFAPSKKASQPKSPRKIHLIFGGYRVVKINAPFYILNPQPWTEKTAMDTDRKVSKKKSVKYFKIFL